MASQNIYLRTFQPNAFIFTEGSQSTEVYLVRSGRVELTKQIKGEPLLLKTLGPKEIFGEMALIGNNPRSATAKALIETECYVLTSSAFDEKLEAMDPFLRGIFRIMANTIRDMTLENSKQLEQISQLELTISRMEKQAAALEEERKAKEAAEQEEDNGY